MRRGEQGLQPQGLQVRGARFLEAGGVAQDVTQEEMEQRGLRLEADCFLTGRDRLGRPAEVQQHLPEVGLRERGRGRQLGGVSEMLQGLLSPAKQTQDFRKAAVGAGGAGSQPQLTVELLGRLLVPPRPL